MSAVCLDQKKPARLSEPHGPWWLTIRVPLGRNRHAYIAAATASRFVPGRHSGGRVLIDTERLAVLVMPRKFHGGRSIHGWIFLHRFCAHIDVVDAPTDGAR